MRPRLLPGLILWSLGCFSAVQAAQQPNVPENLTGLLIKAQEFRTLMSAGRLVESLAYILPEKRDLVLAAGKILYTNPQVVGMDLTDDSDRVGVRVALEMPAAVSGTVGRDWIASDPWVKVGGTWYFDADSFDKVLTLDSAEMPVVDTEEITREFDDLFEILESEFELGTLTQTDVRDVPVAIRYTGDVPIRFSTILASRFVDLTAPARRVSADADNIVIRIDTSEWEGPFDIPVPLDIEYRGVTIRRAVTVRGNVFSPLTLSRQAVDPTRPDEFNFVLSNHTDREVRISYITVGGTLDILGHSDVIASEAEGTVRLKKRADVEPGNSLSVVLTESLHGRETYEFVMDLTAPF